MICSKCGAQNIDGVTFCGSCGATMKSPVPPPPPTQTPQHNFQSEGSYQQPPPYGQQQTYNTGQANSGYGSSSYASPLGGPSNGGMVMPKDYMVESIVVTVITFICCCSPISIVLGIIAIIKANNVKTEFERGNINEAISNSESAKKLTIWAGIIAVIFVIIGTVLYFSVVAAIISEAGGMDAFINS